MKLQEWVASYELQIKWKCEKCGAVGTITRWKYEHPDIAVANIKHAHFNMTYNYKHKEDTCPDPEFVIITQEEKSDNKQKAD